MRRGEGFENLIIFKYVCAIMVKVRGWVVGGFQECHRVLQEERRSDVISDLFQTFT